MFKFAANLEVLLHYIVEIGIGFYFINLHGLAELWLPNPYPDSTGPWLQSAIKRNVRLLTLKTAHLLLLLDHTNKEA